MNRMRYKTYTLVLLIITVIALVVTAAMLSLKRSAARRLEAVQVQAPAGPSYGPDIAYYTPNPAPSQENSDTSEDTGSGGYLITIYKGRIAAFEDGRATPVLTGDVQVYLLPEEDIRLLKEGVRVQSLAEARRVLEDFD